MFTEKEMTQAINWLVGLYTSEDCDGMSMRIMMDYAGCDMTELCQALRNNIETVYEYRVSSFAKDSIEYCGKELFNQRAVQLGHSTIWKTKCRAMNIHYRKELWLTEDMSFMIVHCMYLAYEDDPNRCITEYRSVVKPLKEREYTFLAPDILIEELASMCNPVWEGEAIIYEI